MGLQVLARDTPVGALEALGARLQFGPMWRAIVHMSWFWVAEGDTPASRLPGWRLALYDAQALRDTLLPGMRALEQLTLRWFAGPQGPCALTVGRARSLVQGAARGGTPVSDAVLAVALWATQRCEAVFGDVGVKPATGAAAATTLALDALPLRAELRDAAGAGALLNAAPGLLTPSQLALRAAILNGVNAVFVTQCRLPMWRAPLGALHALLTLFEHQCTACFRAYAALVDEGVPWGCVDLVTPAGAVAAAAFPGANGGDAALARVAFDAAHLGLCRAAQGSDWAWVIVALVVEAFQLTQPQIQALVGHAGTWAAVCVPAAVVAPACPPASPAPSTVRLQSWVRQLLRGPKGNPIGLRGLADMACMAAQDVRVPLDKQGGTAEAWAGCVFGTAAYAPGADAVLSAPTDVSAIGGGSAGAGAGAGGGAGGGAGAGADAGLAATTSTWIALANGGPMVTHTSNIAGVYGAGYRHARLGLQPLDRVVALLDAGSSRAPGAPNVALHALVGACVLLDPATNDVWALSPCAPHSVLKQCLQEGLRGRLGGQPPWCLTTKWTCSAVAALWWWMLVKTRDDPDLHAVFCLAAELAARRPRCGLLLAWGGFVRLWRRVSPMPLPPLARWPESVATCPQAVDDIDQAPIMRIKDAACGPCVVPKDLVPVLLPEFVALSRVGAVHDLLAADCAVVAPPAASMHTQLLEDVLMAAVVRFVCRADWRAPRAAEFLQAVVHTAAVGDEDADEGHGGHDDGHGGHDEGHEGHEGTRAPRDPLSALHTWCSVGDADAADGVHDDDGDDDGGTATFPCGEAGDGGVEALQRMWASALDMTWSRGCATAASSVLFAHPATLVSVLVQRFAGMAMNGSS